MADYFTSDHFKLLNKWKGQKRDESNPEQNRAYEELKKAYEVTEAWANEVKSKLFPTGVVKVRKRPTSQANSFLPYNWARIYPATDSPKELAYTVGIEADEGFVVKIDTVGLDDGAPMPPNSATWFRMRLSPTRMPTSAAACDPACRRVSRRDTR